MYKNNEQNKTDVIEAIGWILFYVLAFPFILVFGIIFAALGVLFLAVYSIGALIAWPFTEIAASIKAKRDAKKNTVVVIPEKIEALEDTQHE